jgi:DNA-binding transcriptional ArsR family regulator
MTEADERSSLDLALLDEAAIEAIRCAIGHPLRLLTLRLIASFGTISPRGIVDACEELGSPQALGTASYHVRILREAKLIKQRREVQRRGAIEHFYRLTPLGEKTLERLGG